MSWSLLTAATETFSLVTSGTDESWTETGATAKTYSLVTSGSNESWADDTASDTTTRNTSRFVLLSKITHDGEYVNLQPAVRSTAANARGGGFYVTTSDPIALFASGQSTI